MGVEHHVLCLTGVGPHEQHPAMAQPHMSKPMTMIPRIMVPIIRGMIGGPTPSRSS